MATFDQAAQDYFDPQDPEPRCDICDEPQYTDCGCGPGCSCTEWNGETGCHVVCEERQLDEEDDGESFLRKMENAADEAAAGVPLSERTY